MVVKLIRRPRPAPRKFAGYTDAEGFKTADAPKDWPFGRQRPVHLPPRNRKP